MEGNDRKIDSKVDKQATSLLDITFWSNIVVMAVLVIINIVNVQRGGADGKQLITIASPEFVVIVSAVLCIWMMIRAISALLTKKRLQYVYIVITENGIKGSSMPEPMTRKKPKRFAIEFSEVCEASTVEVAITRKHNVPSLKIGTSVESYIVPAPERLQDILHTVIERMPKN